MNTPQRICYFVPGALSAHPGGAGEAERRQAYLQRHARAGFEAVLRDNPDGPASVESVEDERRAAAAMLATFPDAVADVEAVIIGCFGDPGLRRARECVPGVVVGPAEAGRPCRLRVPSDADRGRLAAASSPAAALAAWEAP